MTFIRSKLFTEMLSDESNFLYFRLIYRTEKAKIGGKKGGGGILQKYNIISNYCVLTIEDPGSGRRPGTSCTAACTRWTGDASGDGDCRPAPGLAASCPMRRLVESRTRRRTTGGVLAGRATCRRTPASSWASGCCRRAGPCRRGPRDRRRHRRHRRCILRSGSADCRTTSRCLRKQNGPRVRQK